MKNRKVPKLRFKEFTEDWEEKKLGEISNFLDEKRKPLKDNERSKKRGIYPYYGASGIIDYIDDYIFDKELILLGEDGANILTRNSKLAFLAKGKYWVNNHAHVIEGKKNINQYFLCEYLENLDYRQYNTGTAQPKLNQEICKKILIKIPTLQEQQKIADFLSCVDTKISLTEEKLENLKIYKKGIMQKIFSQEIRFKDKNGNDYPEWEEKRLGDLVEEYIEKTTVNNQYQVLSSTATGIYLQEEYFKKQTASENNIGYRIIPKNYFTYRSMSDTGNFTFNIQKIIEKGIVSPAYPVFKNKQEVILKEYLYFTLNNSKKIIEQILVLKEGGTRYALSFSKFLKLKLDVPILEEQQKIADFLSSIDDKIEKTENKLNELKEFKKGLLQKMFV